MIGNPPWERLKLQEREFFAFTAPEIAGAVSAAAAASVSPNWSRKTLSCTRAIFRRRVRPIAHWNMSREWPISACWKGDINTYAIFAELARQIVAPQGRVGLLVPSGIATDNTTKEFFAELMESQALISLSDFENRRKIFPDVDGRFKFCTLLFGGAAVKTKSADFAFFLHTMDQLTEKDRHIRLSAADLRLTNPNTHTCPVFRSRRDAELTKRIYQRIRSWSITVGARVATLGASGSSRCSTKQTTRSCFTRPSSSKRWGSSSAATDG